MWTKPCIRRKGTARPGLRRRNRMYPGYRFPRGHLRQGGCVCRCIHRLLPDDTRVSRQPDANPYLHHGIASDKYCLDTVYRTGKLAGMQDHREHLARISRTLREALQAKGYGCPSASHIVPLIIGPSADTVLCAELLQRHGFYALPVRPPTVPEGTSRIRFSLTADIREDEIGELIPLIPLKEERNTNAIRF